MCSTWCILSNSSLPLIREQSEMPSEARDWNHQRSTVRNQVSFASNFATQTARDLRRTCSSIHLLFFCSFKGCSKLQASELTAKTTVQITLLLPKCRCPINIGATGDELPQFAHKSALKQLPTADRCHYSPNSSLPIVRPGIAICGRHALWQ